MNTPSHADSPQSVSLGIDIGGTKIAFGLIDDSAPTQLLVHERVASQAGQGIHQALTEVLQRARELAAQRGLCVSRIGVGSPGVVDPARGVVVSASPTIAHWPGTDLYSFVDAVFPDIPVAIHNDVRVWAFGEHRLGAGRDFPHSRVLYVSLGTGVGGAIVDNGQLLDSPQGTAGEINELLASDFRGRADRAENIASGESLARYYNELRANPQVGRIAWRERRAGEVDLAEVLRRAEVGDELASRIISGNLAGLGAALGGLARACDIAAVVLGGGVAGIGPFVREQVQRGLREWLPSDNPEIAVVGSRFQAHEAPAVLAAAEYARHGQVTQRRSGTYEQPAPTREYLDRTGE